VAIGEGDDEERMTPTIQIMQPAWRGDEGRARLEAFWAEIDRDPMSVVLVAVYDDERWSFGGLFSTRSNAMEWATRRRAACVLEPKRIDCPDWGNVTVQ
jgi:hypothetical protein